MRQDGMADDGGAARSRGAPGLRPAATVVLASGAVLWSALHFWPFESSRAWQFLYPPNSIPVLWAVALAACASARRNWRKAVAPLPHVSVLAFLVISLLSVAFAQSASRAVSFSLKLALLYLAGYALFRTALSGPGAVRMVMGAVLAAVAICVLAALAGRFILHSQGIGFFGEAHRYGTYVGILAPLGGAYLLLTPGWRRFAGASLIVLAAASLETLGGLAATAAGMVVLAIVASGRMTRVWAIGTLLCAAGLALTLNGGAGRSLLGDLRFADADRENLRQRYIEWQAEINLLEDRAVAGTGAGSINDYRSAYYGRLPKLNTLAAFDQNGWLASAAETGVLGLVAFCWIAGCHVQMAWRRLACIDWSRPLFVVDRSAVAGLVALGAAFVAHLFSSVHYNGVLISFVLVLALVSPPAFPAEDR